MKFFIPIVNTNTKTANLIFKTIISSSNATVVNLPANGTAEATNENVTGAVTPSGNNTMLIIIVAIIVVALIVYLVFRMKKNKR